MSLRIWLPLKSRLSPQNGISDYRTNWTADDTATDGKIGRCAKFTSAKDTHIPYTEWNYANNSISFGAWFKFNQSDIATAINGLSYDTNNRVVKCGLLGYDNYGGFELRLQTNDIYTDGSFNAVKCYVALRSSSNKANISYATGNYTVPFDTWTHIFVVLDREEAKFSMYINGSLYATSNFALDKINNDTMDDRYQNLRICGNSMDGGVARVRSMPFKMNDLRIYDEALSPKQIKEIAKGLVAHYKFDDINGDNIVTTLSGGNHVSHPDKYTTVTDGQSADTYFYININTTFVQDTKYTISFIVEGIQNVGDYSYKINNDSHGEIVLKNGLNKCSFTCLSTLAGKNRLLFDDYIRPSTGYSIILRNFTIIVNNNTNNKITNVSGYYHLLQPKTGVATLSTDTPRYKLSTCNNNDYFYYRGFYTSGDTTISVWVKPTAITSTTQWICNLGTGTGVNCQHGIFITSGGVRAQGGTASDVVYNTTISDNTWYYIASVKSGTNLYLYFNGVKVATGTADATLTKNIMTICDRADGTTPGSSAGYRFQGQLSDLRFYCTALTDNDIKELYQTGAVIDNKNNMLAYEFIEE